MELYYKDLISEDASLDQLVDDLMRAVQGADEIVAVAGSRLDPQQHKELLSRLERLRLGCLQLRSHAYSTARATDKLLRRFPYSSLAVAFGFGLLTGVLFCRRIASPTREE